MLIAIIFNKAKNSYAIKANLQMTSRRHRSIRISFWFQKFHKFSDLNSRWENLSERQIYNPTGRRCSNNKMSIARRAHTNISILFTREIRVFVSYLNVFCRGKSINLGINFLLLVSFFFFVACWKNNEKSQTLEKRTKNFCFPRLSLNIKMKFFHFKRNQKWDFWGKVRQETWGSFSFYPKLFFPLQAVRMAKQRAGSIHGSRRNSNHV